MSPQEVVIYNIRFTDTDSGELIRYPTPSELNNIRELIDDAAMGESMESLDRYAKRVTGYSEVTLEWESSIRPSM